MNEFYSLHVLYNLGNNVFSKLQWSFCRSLDLLQDKWRMYWQRASGCESSISSNWNWNLTAYLITMRFNSFIVTEIRFRSVLNLLYKMRLLRDRPVDLDPGSSTHKSLWPGCGFENTTDDMEKKSLSSYPPSAPQTGICSFCATPVKSTGAGSTCRPFRSDWDKVHLGGDPCLREPTIRKHWPSNNKSFK